MFINPGRPSDLWYNENMKKKDEKKKESEVFRLRKDAIYLCHDCEKDILVKEVGEDLEILGGKLCFYKDKETTVGIVKCDECYAKNQSLEHYRDCLVYSRVVGYITPVKQWHPGKQEEYKERVVFKTNETK